MTTDLGRDISCTTSLVTGRTVTGVRLLAEAVLRRLSTRRGTLRGGEDEANYGIDLRDMIGSVSIDRDLPTWPARIAAELTKDERIYRVEVRLDTTRNGPDVSVELAIEVESAVGPFELVLAVGAVTIDILSIRET